MPYKVKIISEAAEDLVEIYQYYQNTQYIEKFHQKFEALLSLLEMWPSDTPKIGRFQKHTVLKRFVVLYEINKTEVRIVRIFDGRSDFQQNL